MIWNWLTGKQRRIRSEERRQKAIAALDGIRSLRIRQGETRERNLQRKEEFLKKRIQDAIKQKADKESHPDAMLPKRVRMAELQKRFEAEDGGDKITAEN